MTATEKIGKNLPELHWRCLDVGNASREEADKGWFSLSSVEHSEDNYVEKLRMNLPVEFNHRQLDVDELRWGADKGSFLMSVEHVIDDNYTEKL